jgi:hypothetical protein
MVVGSKKTFGKLKGKGEVIRKNGVKEPIEFEVDVDKQQHEKLQKHFNKNNRS